MGPKKGEKPNHQDLQFSLEKASKDNDDFMNNYNEDYLYGGKSASASINSLEVIQKILLNFYFCPVLRINGYLFRHF